MDHQAVSLMDVLAPPENHWLKELLGRKADLPAGVSVIRFSGAEDDPAEDSERADTPARRQKMAA